jgi:hypothetical protein
MLQHAGEQDAVAFLVGAGTFEMHAVEGDEVAILGEQFGVGDSIAAIPALGELLQEPEQGAFIRSAADIRG